MKKILPVIFLTNLFFGCSAPPLTEDDKRRVNSCYESLKSRLGSLEAMRYHEIPDNETDRSKIIDRMQYSFVKSALYDTKSYLEAITKSGRRDKFQWQLSADERGCPLDEIDRTISIRRERDLGDQKKAALEKSIDQMNREIDAAQDAVIDEYRRKAVKHLSDASGHVKVDTFVMKGGNIVICKTTVTNAGKAVSCN